LIYKHLTHLLIRWSSNAAETLYINNDFERQLGMRKVIGAIDGSHIPITAPRQNQEVYISRRGFHSIVLQAICNHKLVFTYCFVGCPGSTHDARVFRRSDIYRRLIEDRETKFMTIVTSLETQPIL
jgi:hypothetical protein